MKKLFLGAIVPALAFTLIACSDDSSSSNEILHYHYDTSYSYDETVLSLDSLSECLHKSDAIDEFDGKDSAFIETSDKRTSLTFQAYIYVPRSNIKSVGAYALGDTLKLELIEKEKMPDADLFCPIYVYTTVKGEIDSRYISTASGVYALGKK